MNTALIIIAVFLAIAIYLGISSGKGKDMTLEQWTVGGRGFGTLLVFFLMAGEAYTTFTFLGGSSAAYGMGAASFYIFVAGPSYALAYWILPRIWRYGNKHKLLSQSDFFASKYNSKNLGILVSIVGVISLIPYLCLQLKGLGIIVSEASYGSISPTAAIWIGLISVCIYVMISGLNGSAWTAVIKDIMILVVVLFMAFYLPYHYYGGIEPMFREIDKSKPGFLLFADAGLSVSWFVSIGLTWALGIWCWPHMWPALFSSKDEKTIKRNTVINPIYMLILVFVLFIGFSAVLQLPELEDPDLALFTLAKMTFPQWFVGIIGAAGMLAALVPCSIMLMSTSTLVSRNIVQALKHDMSDAQVAKLSRVLIPVIALVALFATFKGGNTIVTLLIMGYSFVTQLFPAMVCALSKKNPLNLPGAVCGIIAGVGVVAYTTLTGFTFASIAFLPQAVKDMDVGILALAINLIVSVIVTLATQRATPPYREETAA